MIDKELIQKLIQDPYFGIYTRNGLEYILSLNEHTDMEIYLVDFNNVKGMNNSMGYKKVNDLFKEVFSHLKKDFIIGRAFSGDEIFFCTDNFMIDISHIISVCNKYNLEMNSVKGSYRPAFEDITVVLDDMIDMLHESSNNNLTKRILQLDGKARYN